MSSLFNQDMNNVGAIDYAVGDWLDDNDFCLSRKASEYPRLTPTFKNNLQ